MKATLWIVAVVLALVLAGANLLLGDLNQDEGWYLYAAGLVAGGQRPYVDFASTQGPVMPYVYAPAHFLVMRWGVAGGRLFTGLLGLATALAGAWLAARTAIRGRRTSAALIAFALVAVNVYQSYFFTIVKTYALTGLLVMLGFLALSFAAGPCGAVAAALAGAMMSLGAGTRISAGVLLPVVFAALLLAGTRPGCSRLWLWFGLGASVTGVLIFAPFLMRAPQAVWFALVEYHAGRTKGGIVKQLVYKAGFVSRLVRAYFVAVALSVSAGLYAWLGGRRPGSHASELAKRHMPVLLPCLWLGALAVSLVHFAAPFPYDDYQVFVFPVFAVALAVVLTELAAGGQAGTDGSGSSTAESWLPLTVVVLCAAAAFSSTINQDWFAGKRDRIWWPVKQRAPLTTLRETARAIRSISEPGDLLLTQDTYLAVESGRRVPPGLELGPFSYFPDWTRVRAQACHVLNREMLIELLAGTDAPVAAFSGYGLAIRCPEVAELSAAEQDELWAAVEARYALHDEIEDFGQAYTKLKVLKRR